MKHLLDTLKWWVPWLFERDQAVAVASEAPAPTAPTPTETSGVDLSRKRTVFLYRFDNEIGISTATQGQTVKGWSGRIRWCRPDLID